MQRLLPTPIAEVDPVDAHFDLDRPSPADRPWVVANMISSLDGAATVEGRSGGLGGPADRAVFLALRAVADVVMAGGATVRTERYGPVRLTDDLRARRAVDGRPPTPALAVVTGSLGLDFASAAFSEAEQPTLVITSEGAPRDRLAAARAAGDVVVAGRERVDLTAALADLRARGVGTVLCEGGPSLLGQLVAADLVDEICVSVAPLVAGGDARRIVTGPIGEPRGLRLDLALEAEGLLLLRYLRA